MATNVYIGATEHLTLLKDDDIIGFTFTVTNSDTTAYDFTGYTDQNLYIYSDKNKTNLVATILAADLVIASNVITWSSDYSVSIALDTDLYFYNLAYEDATSRPITVAKGNFEVIYG